MINLKRSNIKFLLGFFLISSCQTYTVFEMRSDEKRELNVVKIKSDRIIHECYFLNAEKENQWRHQYFLYMLTDKNDVIGVMYPINLEKDVCEEQLKKVEKIFKNDSEVTLCVRDLLKKDTEVYSSIELHDFGQLGKHSTPFSYLTFDTICNSKECFSISDTWTFTCPREILQKP